MKGLLVNVYRTALGDSTNGGVTSTHDRVILVGPGIPEIFDVTATVPALFLAWRKPFGNYPAYLLAMPEQSTNPDDPLFGKKQWMFGGNFIFSSDSRFRELNPNDTFGSPIPVFDRAE